MRVGFLLLALAAAGCGGVRVRADEPKQAPAARFEVEVIKDLVYYEGKDADPVKHKLDLYLPKGQKDSPVLLFVHGGAWTWGDKSLCASVGKVFAARGVSTAVISYRLSPKVMRPVHIQDVARAFAWVHDNIGKYSGKADQIFVSGHSAGGHLVALLATDESYLKVEKLSFREIKGVIPTSGVYTITPLFSSVFGKDEAACKEASPRQHVTENHPPFLIIYGDKDFPFCDLMSEDLGKALRRARCEAECLKVEHRDHFRILIRMGKDDDPAAQAMMGFIATQTGHKPDARQPRN